MMYKFFPLSCLIGVILLQEISFVIHQKEKGSTNCSPKNGSELYIYSFKPKTITYYYSPAYTSRSIHEFKDICFVCCFSFV